jgi:hypothetical protein
MSKLFVANTSKQIQLFAYCHQEWTGPRHMSIAPGAQVQFAENFTQAELDSIISAHAAYGMVRASELDRTRPHVGLVYDIDKPVKLNAIEGTLFDHNNKALAAQSKEIMKEQTAAMAQQVEHQMNTPVNALHVTVQETERKDSHSPTVHDQYVVTDNPTPASPSPKGRRRAA